MSSPDEINRALSERMDQIVSTYFPTPPSPGASWNMGDLDGGAGKSTGIFRGKGGIYFAKDRATDETLNVLAYYTVPSAVRGSRPSQLLRRCAVSLTLRR
jgi:hypothetical protein